MAAIGSGNHVSSRGSQEIYLDVDQIRELRTSGLKWSDIAKQLKTNVKKINRWRQKYSFEDPLKSIDDDELKEFVSSYSAENYNRGERMIDGFIKSLGASVSRKRLRAVIAEVDPDGLLLRKSKPITRRVYEVPGPHHLWHVDGWHKMIIFGFVVHGCIDGFSRKILFMHCSNNNKSETVFSLFHRATENNGIPSRVRSDHGGENVLICDFMLEKRGLNRGSMLCGKSVHNQRIERLWKDVRERALTYYKCFFQSLADQGIIDFDDQCQKFVIHYLFTDRINMDLQVFIEAWNNHKIRTITGERTPNQLILLHNDDNAAILHEDLPDENDWWPNGQNDDIPMVECPPVICPLSEEQLNEFQMRVIPMTLRDTIDTFIDRIQHALITIHEILATP